MEIKIDRRIHEDVRRDIFVKTPGNGRHRCLMGIYQIGKTQLVKDWIQDWTAARKKNLQQFKAELLEISLTSEISDESLYRIEKTDAETDLESMPEEVKVFCMLNTTFKELKVSELSKIYTSMIKAVFKPIDTVDIKNKTYIKKDEDGNYQIKTVDNFLVTIYDEEKKAALDCIAKVVADKEGNVIEKIKTFAKALTTLGFHLILVFDEFNNGATSSNAEIIMDEEIAKEKNEVIKLFRDLEPYYYDVEGKVAGRKYNLSILIVSRQEFGMITGNFEKDSKDNEIYRFSRMSGFTKSQIEEFISRLKEIKDFSDEMPVYAKVAEAYKGSDKLEKEMLQKCGKHPGLWGSMPTVLRYMYAEKTSGNSVNEAFKNHFEEANKGFFENVIFLLKKTKEKVGETVTVSAYKVYINTFIEPNYYIIKEDVMEKSLSLMARQGLVICCDKEDSLSELKKNLNRKKKAQINFLPFLRKTEQKDIYEMHTPYFVEYLNGILFSTDVEDVIKNSEQVEMLVRNMINEVYKIKFGTGNVYRMKMLNRISRKDFWKDSVQRNYAYLLEHEEELAYVNSKDIVVDESVENKKWENGSALNVSSFGEYAGFIKQYASIFAPAFEKYVVIDGDEYRFEESFDIMIKRMSNLRNAKAHMDGLDVLSPKDWKKQIDFCKELIASIQKGMEEVKKRAQNSKELKIAWEPQEKDSNGYVINFPGCVMEQVLDMYDVPFECAEKFESYASGFITYNGYKFAARIIKNHLCRGTRKKSDFYNEKIEKNKTVQVDVVEYGEKEKNKFFIVQPIARSGLEEQWKKVEEL